MGRRQHQSNKMYISSSEHRDSYGGYKERKEAPLRRLRFNQCRLSLAAAMEPVIAPNGTLYDLQAIVPYLRKHEVDPLTGKRLQIKELVHVVFHRNEDGNFHCPLTFKEFTEQSHVVCIMTSGNVFAYEAVQELNIKPKIWTDLLSGHPFSESDIVTLQGVSAVQIPTLEPKAPIQAPPVKAKATKRPRNTATEPENRQHSVYSLLAEKAAAATKKQKSQYQGLVHMDTNWGPLDLILHCDRAPRASHNMLLHCASGYFVGSVFHRVIPKFMAQAGEPAGSSGQSAWGGTFEDECHDDLRHDRRGVLSMANRGKNTNTSQFFITFGPCSHLDGKHTVFGFVSGCEETLSAIESIKRDKKDMPLTPITISKTTVVRDPFKELSMHSATEKSKKQQLLAFWKRESKEEMDVDTEDALPQVGAYLSKKDRKPMLTVTQPRKKPKRGFGDFSSW